MALPIPNGATNGVSHGRPDMEMPRTGHIENREKPGNPRQLAALVTDVWHHPLLTRHTIEHRRNGIAAFEADIKKHGLNPAEYIALLVGSDVWIVDPERSDSDFIVVCESEKARDKLIKTFPKMEDRRKSLVSYHPVTEHDIKFSIIFNSPYNERNSALASLFLTPDEYAAGNLERLGQLRLEIVDLIRQTPGAINRVWDGEKARREKKPSRVQQEFREHYNLWGFRELRHTTPTPTPDADKRERRIYAMLEARGRRIVELMYPAERRNLATLKQITNVYRNWFFNGLGSLTFPTFAEVEEELNSTQGKVNVVQERAAHHDLQPGQPARCVWGDTYVTIPTEPQLTQ